MGPVDEDVERGACPVRVKPRDRRAYSSLADIFSGRFTYLAMTECYLKQALRPLAQVSSASSGQINIWPFSLFLELGLDNQNTTGHFV